MIWISDRQFLLVSDLSLHIFEVEVEVFHYSVVFVIVMRR
jgi:hypothetical protein